MKTTDNECLYYYKGHPSNTAHDCFYGVWHFNDILGKMWNPAAGKKSKLLYNIVDLIINTNGT